MKSQNSENWVIPLISDQNVVMMSSENLVDDVIVDFLMTFCNRHQKINNDASNGIFRNYDLNLGALARNIFLCF